MQDQECLELFQKHLVEEKNCSSNTLESYMRDIRQLAAFLSARGSSLAGATEEDLNAYIESLRAMNKSVATVSRSIASIKNFYMQLCIRKVIEKSAATNLHPEKAETKLPEILSNEEIDLLLKQPKCVDAKGYRDHAMLELMYATGMRVSELLDLNMDDIDLDEQAVRCHGKGKERLVPIYPAAVEALSDYITLVRPQMISSPDEPALFVNVGGDRMSRQGFWKLIKHYTDMAGIKKDITPHTLRHSFATHLLENGADMRDIQELLGFSDLSSAQVYSQVIKSDLKSVYSKAHPRAN